MIKLLKQIFAGNSAATNVDFSQQDWARAQGLLSNLHFELIPLKSIDNAIECLPRASKVSVTCSPNKSIAVTQEYCERLLKLGHEPVPHFAARMVQSQQHTKQLAKWLKDTRIKRVFVPGGDMPSQLGPYASAKEFLRDFCQLDSGVNAIGITGYPDGHALIKDEVLIEHLKAKIDILASAKLDGWISTQMCFDDEQIGSWITSLREQGVSLPIWLGMAGVVDKTRLMTMSARLGIGRSLRFLKNNRANMTALLTPGGYDPSLAMAHFVPQAEQLNIEAIHCFTFNCVEETSAWRGAFLNNAPKV